MDKWLDKIARASRWCHQALGTGGLIGAVAIIVVCFVAVGAVSTSNSALRAVEDQAASVMRAVEDQAAEMAVVFDYVVENRKLLAELSVHQQATWESMASEVNAALASVPTNVALSSVEAAVERVEQDVSGLRIAIAGLGDAGQNFDRPSEEVWWYAVQVALSDPGMIRVALAPAGGSGSFTVTERIFLKDFDHLMLSSADQAGAKYISGGVMVGQILSLPPGNYYHRANSGVMYVTESDITSIQYDPVERYYRRIRYVLTALPDIEMRTSDTEGSNRYAVFEIGPNGSVISFGAAGNGFVVANLTLENGNGWRSVNRLGLSVFSQAAGFMTTPLTMVPVPADGYGAALRVYHGSEGFSVFRIHHVPGWW